MCLNNYSETTCGERRIFKIPIKNLKSKPWWKFWKSKNSEAESAIVDLISKFNEEVSLDELFLPVNKQEQEKLTAMFKTYNISEIKKVYERHRNFFGTVLYSDNFGHTWHPVPTDTGKWNKTEWEFLFVEKA